MEVQCVCNWPQMNRWKPLRVLEEPAGYLVVTLSHHMPCCSCTWHLDPSPCSLSRSTFYKIWSVNTVSSTCRLHACVKILPPANKSCSLMNDCWDLDTSLFGISRTSTVMGYPNHHELSHTHYITAYVNFDTQEVQWNSHRWGTLQICRIACPRITQRRRGGGN